LSQPVPKASDLPERVRREIESRMRELRPFVDEYEELLAIERTLGKEARGGNRTAPAPAPTKRERAPRGAAAEAIVAALEHGSHTVSELAVVTAMSTQNIRNNLRRLLHVRTVKQTKREGKTAYELPS
jgi:hypothetical protein